MFPAKLAAKLAGVTPSQLANWRRGGILVPEFKEGTQYLYSLRDVVALRTYARLRSQISLQKIRNAIHNMDLLEMYNHPSAYTLGTDGENVYVRAGDAHAVNLIKLVGETTIFSFEEVTGRFKNFRGDDVPDLWAPAEHLEINPDRMGGWPTIAGTRIPYDVIAQAVDGETITIDDIGEYYPDVTIEAAQDAIDFNAEVNAA